MIGGLRSWPLSIFPSTPNFVDKGWFLSQMRCTLKNIMGRHRSTIARYIVVSVDISAGSYRHFIDLLTVPYKVVPWVY